jgi:ATP-dependent DNA helicase RecQ
MTEPVQVFNTGDVSTGYRSGRPCVETLMRGMANIPAALSQLGFSEMRKGQDAVVARIIAQQDTICVLPTATGKSACYVLPTLACNWKTIIFSPLIALMRDQVQGLRRNGVAAAFINSSNTDAENVQTARSWISGELELLFVAPEQIKNDVFKTCVQSRPPNFVAVDEAHVASEWSDNFRPNYAKIGAFIDEYNPSVVAAFTATLPAEVETDVRRVLGIPNAGKITYYPRRSNLRLSASDHESEGDIIRRLKSIPGPAIVYCSVIQRLLDRAELYSAALGEDIGVYFSKGNSQKANAENMNNFMNGDVRIMVATGAFGLGVDKADIRQVIVADMPRSIEENAQLIGRAGRDGKPSWCLTCWSKDSRKTQDFFLDMGHPDETTIRRVYAGVLHKLGTQKPGTPLVISSKELASLSGVSQIYISAAKMILTASGVFDTVRIDPDDKMWAFRFKKESADDHDFLRFKETVETFGDVSNIPGYYLVAQKALDTVMSKVPLGKKLKLWQEQEVLVYSPPDGRNRPFVISGDIDRVDFARLKRKKEEAYEKLAMVENYIKEVPDEEKHAFMEDYFQIESTQ